MTALPHISVIIPTYNRSALVGKAIESVLSQTCRDLEILVIDDGSRDATAEVVRHFEAEHGGIVQYLCQENQGKSVALNNALAKAKGAFIAYLDSDDTWLPKKLEWQLKAMQAFGEDHPCFTDARYVNNDKLQVTAFEFAGKKYEKDIDLVADPTALFLSTRSGVYIQTLLLRKDLALRVGPFDPKLRVGNDTDYMFRLALLSPFSVVNKPLVQIDRTPNREDGLIEQMTRDEWLRLSEREHLFTKWLDLTHGNADEMRSQLLERLAETHNEWANCHLVNRNYLAACRSMWTSIGTHFTPKAAFKLALTVTAPAFARREVVSREAERAKSRVVT